MLICSSCYLRAGVSILQTLQLAFSKITKLPLSLFLPVSVIYIDSSKNKIMHSVSYYIAYQGKSIFFRNRSNSANK